MRRFFTPKLVLLVLGFVSSNLIGQTINTLTVNSPSGIAGDYLAVRAAFGSQSNTPITANAAFVNDGNTNATLGCALATNNITGLITFIDRGACSVAVDGEFGSKALKAQTRGALVAIICNSAANATQVPFPMVTGTNGAMVNIPVFMVSYTDCQKIRADIIAGGVNVTLRNTCVSKAAYGPEVIWGKLPGEGDFKGGLNDWTVDKENTWEYNADGNISRGAYGGVQMTSHSACDGAMEFNSDYLDNLGIQGNFGAGPCPSPCTGALISPNIDLSGHTIEGIVIEFHQALRQFQSLYYLIVSTDGGLNWQDTIQFNTEYPVNSAAISGERKRLALVGFQGISQIRFKFEYVGDYYYWGIDDVVVINESKADPKVNENFYAVAPSLRVPATQVSEMPFLADVSNLGNGNATNVALEVVITDEANAEIVRLTNNYGTLVAGSLQENDPFNQLWTPPAVPGRYNGSYIITSTEEPTGTNNKVDFFFDITENTFANLLPEEIVTPVNYMSYVLSPWVVGGEVTYYSAGNSYFVKEGDGFTIDKVRFGLANDIANISESGFINVDVYEWVDTDGDNEAAPLERTKVGTNFIFIDGSIPDSRVIELPIWALDTEGGPNDGVEVDIKDNTTYLVMAHTSPLDPSVERYQLLGYTGRTFSAFDRSTNYAATTYAFDTLHIERNAGSLFGLTGTSEADVADREFEIVQNGPTQSAVYLEMDIKQATSTYDIDDKAVVSTFPNPASRELYVDLTLEKVSQNVKIDLISLDGKVVLTRSFSNVQDSRLRIDLSQVVSGAYSALIHTDAGVITRKVIVQK
ncbi:MAG: T9SS type A sorting domain-containing protein [Saprospiraceae bacterium]|nr:T9SS type A sorting domain-containing protein [Saprospiraceae bacterium]